MYRQTFSILMPQCGGWKKAELRKELRKLGVTDIQDDFTPYVGHRGISIPNTQVTDEVETVFFRKG